MKRVTGGGLPTIIWRDIMTYAHVSKQPAYLPGVDQAVAYDDSRGFANRRSGGESFWDSLFGGGSASSRDPTLGTPVASSGGGVGVEPRSTGRRSSWFEDLFGR
jgi:hypothetical protein